MKIIKVIGFILLALLLTFAHYSRSGDVNCNGRVSITDLVILHRYVVDKEPMMCPGNADMNDDYKIDMKDVEALRKFLAE